MFVNSNGKLSQIIVGGVLISNCSGEQIFCLYLMRLCVLIAIILHFYLCAFTVILSIQYTLFGALVSLMGLSTSDDY